MENQILPNLIIAGVNKSGTTSLFTYLSQHPDVCISNTKETCYFLPVRYKKKIAPLSEYIKYFNHYSGQKYIVESTPGYFYGGVDLAQTIKDALGTIKIVIILRSPIDRLFSFYKSQKGKLILDKDLTFKEYIKECESLGKEKVVLQEYNKYWGVMGGFYSDYLDAWYDTFGEENVKILFFDDLKTDALSFLNGICKWLGIDSDVYDAKKFIVENKSVNFRNRTLHAIALGFNKYSERFLRRYPAIKQFARAIYFKINTKIFDETMNEEERTYLIRLYEESNRTLSLKLGEKGYNQLPNWLFNT